MESSCDEMAALFLNFITDKYCHFFLTSILVRNSEPVKEDTNSRRNIYLRKARKSHNLEIMTNNPEYSKRINICLIWN